MKLSPARRLRGEVVIPGDKSISHRSIMFGALARGDTHITHFLKGADCLSTIRCFRQLGIEIDETDEEIVVHGKGLYGLQQPTDPLDVGNSGTTMRLLSGILAGQPFSSTLTGDASIQKRPMNRIITPLQQMGARLAGHGPKGVAPLSILPSHLQGIAYQSPVASAQVKSCVLLAGLYAEGPTCVTEPVLSRNHTELMLRAFGCDLSSRGTTCTVVPGPHLQGISIDVPGDISSAAYWIAAGLLLPDSEIRIKNVGINPTRDGVLKVCRAMGGTILEENHRICGGEPVADLIVKTSALHGTTVRGEIIPTLIDELPVIAVLGAFAEGTTTIADAAELKVKESDRIAVVTKNLQAMGADATPTCDGMIIRGGKPLYGACIDTHLDHRIAMSFAVAALRAKGETTIQGASCVEISYPGFFRTLSGLAQTE